ncbi:amino acid adenylation domain-containing protein [Streptomyces sp. NPDC047097]|uniref:amino acid adenylation domain-containing protein n=1 Tax=Streptomyces sp. NPDC047097 TaxID=3155260 RepID=UPI0033FA256C
MVERFREQVARTPEGIAVGGAAGLHTYSGIDRRSDSLARLLLAAGVRPETAVAVLCRHSPEFVISVLAILKAGGCYVPLRAEDPLVRKNTILDETGAGILLVDAELRSAVAGIGADVTVVDATARQDPLRPPLPAAGIGPERLAYIMYTSGSTGRPKAIGITHQAVVTLATAEAFRRDEHRRVLLHSPISFDASTYELWVPLLNGGQVVTPRTAFDKTAPEAVRQEIRKSGVTGLFLTPALVELLAETDPTCLRGARELWFGGEAAPARALREIARACPGLSLVNGYGPTEETTFATFHRLSPGDAVPDPVPIGRPMTGTEALVLDDRLRPLPVGAAGDLYLSGPGLARGYLGRPALTAERFVARPGGRPGERMYRTGDLVRRNEEGALEYLGRSDDMVKISGLRIEPGEIEAALARLPAVARAVVMAVESHRGRKQLVAFVQARVHPLDLAAVRAGLGRTLPDYMLPAVYLPVTEFPITPNGKIDRAALRALLTVKPSRTLSAGPLSDAEREMADLWCQVLDVEDIGRDDDFFDLGGDSLSALRLAARIRSRDGRELTTRDVFENRTIASLLKHLDEAPLVAALRPAPEGRTAMTQGQLGLWVSNQFSPGPQYNLPFVVHCPRLLDAEALEAALADLIGRHAVLRTLYPRADDGSVHAVIGDPHGRAAPFDVRPVGTDPVEELVAAAAHHAFDLEHELPVRALLLQGQGESTFLLLIHHIACDGASLVPLFDDLAEAYRARRAGTAPRWRPLELQFNDHAVHEDRALAEGRWTEHLRFWTEELAALPEEIALPADRPRRPSAGGRGDTVFLPLPSEFRPALAAVTGATGAGVLAVLQAALAGLLTRLGAGTDIPIGTVTAGRTRAETERMVGFFANTLTLRTNTSSDPTFTELVLRCRQTGLAAAAHQDVPFRLVVEALNPPRVRGRHPLFQVALILQSNPWPRIILEDAPARVGLAPTGTAKFALQIEVWDRPSPTAEPITCTAEFDTDRFDRETVAWFLDSWKRFLENALRQPDQKISLIPLSEERPASSR